MPPAANDDVVVDGDPQRRCGLDDVFGDGDVGLRRGRVARRVVVHQDERRGAQLKRALDDLAGIDRRVVDRAALLLFVGDQRVLAVEEQQVKLLDLAVGDVRAAIIDRMYPLDVRNPSCYIPLRWRGRWLSSSRFKTFSSASQMTIAASRT